MWRRRPRHKHEWTAWSDPEQLPAKILVYVQRRHCVVPECNLHQMREVPF